MKFFLKEDKQLLSYTVNTIAADDLVVEGARAPIQYKDVFLPVKEMPLRR